MNGTAMLQPRPTGPLPPLVAYASVTLGCTPARPGGSVIGTLNVPVPELSEGVNDSPMPCTEPSPEGSEIADELTEPAWPPFGRDVGVRESLCVSSEDSEADPEARARDSRSSRAR